jgi:hypothetical protein
LWPLSLGPDLSPRSRIPTLKVRRGRGPDALGRRAIERSEGNKEGILSKSVAPDFLTRLSTASNPQMKASFRV